jgi:molybdenum cofactor synthesis domain-containing protein
MARNLEGVRAAVLTVSDRASRGEAQDLSGPELVKLLKENKAEVVDHQCVPDEMVDIQKAVLNFIKEQNVQLVLTSGGTGLSPRDVTPEALQAICQRVVPGFGEAMRIQSAQTVATSWLSRSLAVQIDGALVIAIPGSFKAAGECFEILKPFLGHALFIMKGSSH